MLKRFGTIIGCLCLMLILVGCSEKYSEEDIIGKTSDEILFYIYFDENGIA